MCGLPYFERALPSLHTLHLDGEVAMAHYFVLTHTGRPLLRLHWNKMHFVRPHLMSCPLGKFSVSSDVQFCSI